MGLLDTLLKVSAKHAFNKVKDNNISQRVIQSGVKVNTLAAQSNNKLVSSTAKVIQVSSEVGKAVQEHQRFESGSHLGFGSVLICAIPAALLGAVVGIVSDSSIAGWLSGSIAFGIDLCILKVVRKALRRKSPFLADVADELLKGVGKKTAP